MVSTLKPARAVSAHVGHMLDSATKQEKRRLVLAGVPTLAVVVSLAISGVRARFPSDLWMWSESTTLTNVLKLREHVPIYGPPGDANSQIYSPGLDYLNYALLRPFHAELSPFAHRSLIIGYGLIAAFLLSLSLRHVLTPALRRAETGLAFCLIYLAIARGPMSDVIHPDSLFLLLVCAVFALTVHASAKGDMRLALAAVALGSFGVLAKQQGVLIGVAAAVSLLFSAALSRLQKAVLLVTTGAVTAIVALALLSDRNARFYLFDLVNKHWVQWDRLNALRDDFIGAPIWIVVLGGVLVTFVQLRPPKEWTAAYVAFFVLACGPSLFGYLKVDGAINNLVAARVFLVLGAVPGVIHFAWRQRLRLTIVGVLVATVFLMPLKALPTGQTRYYADQLQAAVSEAADQGGPVLLAHGTVPLMKAGLTDVPLDRAESVLQLDLGGELDRVDTFKRIEDRYYDRIILNTPTFGGDIEAAIFDNYREIGRILAPRHDQGIDIGSQSLFNEVIILERR